jgi:hypothetical protein
MNGYRSVLGLQAPYLALLRRQGSIVTIGKGTTGPRTIACRQGNCSCRSLGGEGPRTIAVPASDTSRNSWLVDNQMRCPISRVNVAAWRRRGGCLHSSSVVETAKCSHRGVCPRGTYRCLPLLDPTRNAHCLNALRVGAIRPSRNVNRTERKVGIRLMI